MNNQMQIDCISPSFLCYWLLVTGYLLLSYWLLGEFTNNLITDVTHEQNIYSLFDTMR
jgi:hypothetical protein